MDANQELQDLIAELVKLDTENPPGNEAVGAEFIADWFETNGIGATIVTEPYEDRPQVAVKVGDASPTIVLNGHIDVVPAGDQDKWNYDPYGAEIVDGRLYGRGSVDMKTGLAIGMLTTREFKRRFERDERDGSIVFHAAIGEETGEPGTKVLLEKGFTGDYGVNLEPSACKTATRIKGTAWYEVTIEGEPAHAMNPEQGQNAIVEAKPVIEALIEYDNRVRQREDDLCGRAYATITEFQAGTKENVLPEKATITIDRRVLPDESMDDIDNEIDDLLTRVAEEHNLQADWNRKKTYESASVPENSLVAQVFRRYSKELANVPTDPFGTIGATDARNLINDAGIESITWGPGDYTKGHTFDECVDLSAAAVGYKILLRSVEELLSSET